MSADASPTPAQATAHVSFDACVYALPVIKKAAYRFLKTFTTDIRQDGDAWECTLAFSSPMNDGAIEQACQALRAEVLDQDLRESVGRETEAVRNAVLALAFSRTGLQGGE